MTSQFLSRLLSSNNGSPSIYETFQEPDEGDSETSDLENQAGTTRRHEQNLHRTPRGLRSPTFNASIQTPYMEASIRQKKGGRRYRGSYIPNAQTPRQSRLPVNLPEADDADDDVPPSLLTEENQGLPIVVDDGEGGEQDPLVSQRPSSSGSERAKWQATQHQQRLYQDSPSSITTTERTQPVRNPLMMIDPKEQALWRWANVENLDNFLRDVYRYYLGKGIWSILLSRFLNLLTLLFVVGFGTFLTSCIDYKKIPNSKGTADILVPQCTKQMSGFANLLIWLFVFMWVFKLFEYTYKIRELKHMYDFYHHLLDIPDKDIQTISWQEVVKRLMALRDANLSTAAVHPERRRRLLKSQSKQRMDAHDIANRLMRRENFLVALINKDVLDLTLPIPFLGNHQFFSKTLEWNLSLSILDFVFDETGQVRPIFLKDSNRRDLSKALRTRFFVYGLINVACAPFIVAYLAFYSFFRYFNEFQRNPSRLGSRQYTPLAKWKFREFNELWHLFDRRINMSYPFASRYVDQFPKEKTVQFARFVAFVFGALASVLAAASLLDPELFLGFELTPDRTVLFYLGIFGAIWATARGSVPEENLVFDPEYSLKDVVEYTHYLPNSWIGRLHSDEVRQDFARLYQMKVVIFIEELLGVLITPFLLWHSLPTRSDRIVDFFREFTVHVDGLGYVCSFAVFDFKKGGNVATPHQDSDTAKDDLRGDFYATKDNKMLASYYGFIDNYVTNPKTGVQFPQQSQRRQFHPPPQFPPMISPKAKAEAGPSRPTSRQPRSGQSGVLSARTPRFAPINSHYSPVTSILLDPTHQPMPSSLKAMGTASNLARSRRLQPVSTDIMEGEEEDEAAAGTPLRAEASGGVAFESELGESWKTTRVGAQSEEAAKEGASVIDGNRPGVLGLLHQFSKAQTEGRGAGVNI